MPRVRFTIDDPERIYEALVTAGDAARELETVTGDLGPWDDAELRAQHTLELLGPDEFVDNIAARLIEADIGFEVE